jgi:hypothetical protein
MNDVSLVEISFKKSVMSEKSIVTFFDDLLGNGYSMLSWSVGYYAS